MKNKKVFKEEKNSENCKKENQQQTLENGDKKKHKIVKNGQENGDCRQKREKMYT